MFSKNRNLAKISFSLIASALFYVSILHNHSKLFKSSSSSGSVAALLACKPSTAASSMSTGTGAACSSSGSQHSSSSAKSSSSRPHKKLLFEQMSPTFTMIFLIVFYCYCSLFLVVNVNAQENIYYYTDGDAIQMQNNGANEDNHLETLLNKNFFSVFSSEMSILNTVENQSTNGHKLNNNNNNNNDDHQTIYSSTSSGVVLTANQIPIAKFRPAILDFKSQSVGIPKLETVAIHNTGKDVLRLESISGNTIHFYCSFFLERVIQPGGNTTFDVYFLARDVGAVDSSLYVNTNKGIIKYTVTGTGTPNPYRLKPIANARIPINSSFHANIVLHNPHNRSLQVLEIYTSDDDSHLELPFASTFAYNSPLMEHNTIVDDKDVLDSETFLNKMISRNDSAAAADQSIWILNPYETKHVAKLRYMGRHANNHTSFVCVKIATNLNISVNESSSGEKLSIRASNATKILSLILPVEVEVSDQPGIFSPIESINFDIVSVRPPASGDATSEHYEEIGYSSMNAHFFETKRNQAFELYVYSTAQTAVTIDEVYSLRQNSALSIYYYKGIQVSPGLNQLTKIAEILFDPTKSKKQSQNYGKILIKTNDTKISLKIDFSADLHVGSLEFQKEQAMFLTTLQEASQSSEEQLVTQPIELINNYQFPIVIHNISLDKNTQKYFKIQNFRNPATLAKALKKPSKIFEIAFNRTLYALDALEANKQTKRHLAVSVLPPVGYCIIQTNFTNINMPLYAYDGQLSFSKHESGLAKQGDLGVSQVQDEDMDDDFQIDVLNVNSRKQFTFNIANPNPVDINFTKFKLLKLADGSQATTDSIESRLLNTIQFKYVGYEKLPNFHRKEKWDYSDYGDEPELETPVLNGTFVNEQIGDHVIVPAHHKLILQVDISNQLAGLSKATNDFVFSPFLFKYQLAVATKFQVKKFKIEFYVVNGTLELRDRFMKSIEQIDFRSFPTQLLAHQFNLKSTFAQTLKINSVTFAEFGNAFTFKWNIPFTVAVPVPPTSDTSETDVDDGGNSTTNVAATAAVLYQTRNSMFGQIQANETTKIGYVYFDPVVLCSPNCYLGFSKDSDAISSSENVSELVSSKADEAESDYEKRRASQHAQLHTLWTKSFELKTNVPLNKNVSIFDLDSIMFQMYRERWSQLVQNQQLFRTKLRFHIEIDDEKGPVDGKLGAVPAEALQEPLAGTLEERQQKKIQEESAKKFLVYSFPVSFKLKWPRLIKHRPTVVFPLTQVNVASRTQNVTLYNPSNASVLVQVVLLRQYPNRFELLQMLKEHPNFFYENRFTSLIKDLVTEHTPIINRCCRCQQAHPSPASKAFQLKTASTNKQTNLATQRALRTIQLLDMSPNKESIVMLLEPFQTSVVEIQFQPPKVGDHLDVLIVRNNLTIMDAILIKGEGGSGELRINNQPPMKTSLFYDGYFIKSNGEYEPASKSSPEVAAATAETIAKMYKTVDFSSVSIQMNDMDYEKCKNRQLEPIESMQINTNTFSFFGAESKDAAASAAAGADPPPPEYVQGIVLRKFFDVKNVGSSDLTVFQIMFDGEPCTAYGFEITNCQPFTLEPGHVRSIEIKYHPDFTMSFISKRLTINTNIGDLEYLIEVRIPYHMLTLCHDALPRPSLESHIFYLGLFIISILIGAMVLSSFAESRVLLKYEDEIKKKISALNDDNNSLKQDFINQLKLQRSFSIRNFLSSFDLTFFNGSSSSNPGSTGVKSKQGEFHSNGHKNLAKSSSSPRVEPQPTANKKGSLQNNSGLANSKKKLEANNSTDSVVGEQLATVPKTFGSPKSRRSALSKQTSAPHMPPPPLIVNSTMAMATAEEYQATGSSTSTDDEPQQDSQSNNAKTVTFAKKVTPSSSSSATSSPRAIKNKLKQASLVSTSNAASSSSSSQKSTTSSKANGATEKAQRDRDSNSSTPSPPPASHQKNAAAGSLSSIFTTSSVLAQGATNSPIQKKPPNRAKISATAQKSQPAVPTTTNQASANARQSVQQQTFAGVQPSQPKAAPSLIKPGQNALQFRELFLNKPESSIDPKIKSSADSESTPAADLKDANDVLAINSAVNSFFSNKQFLQHAKQNNRNSQPDNDKDSLSARDSKSHQPARFQNNSDLANLMTILNMNNLDLTQLLSNGNAEANNNYFPSINDTIRMAPDPATAQFPLVNPMIFDGRSNGNEPASASSMLIPDYPGTIMDPEQQRQLDQLNIQFLNIQRQKKQMERESMLNNLNTATSPLDTSGPYSKLNNIDINPPLLPTNADDFSNLESSALLTLLRQASQQDHLKLDFDNLVKETAEFNDLHQKLATLEGNHKSDNGKQRAENSKTTQKADKRSASRSFSMPFQQQVANTSSDERYQKDTKAKASSNFNNESATQSKAPGPIQRPSNASNQPSLNSFYGDENNSMFGKNLLWSDNILFSDLTNNSDTVPHLNLKSSNTSDDDLVLLSKDPSMDPSAGLKFNEFRLFGNTSPEPSKSAIGADLLNNILSTSSIWPAGDQELSSRNSADKSSSGLNAPWNSILLDDYQCSPLAVPDDGTGIKFDFPDIKSEDKLKSIWSDINGSEDDDDKEAAETTKKQK